MKKRSRAQQSPAPLETWATPHSSERRSIRLNHRHEIDFWAGELAATEAELREAVRKAGPVVEDVRRYLAIVRRYLGESGSNPGGVPPRPGGPDASEFGRGTMGSV